MFKHSTKVLLVAIYCFSVQEVTSHESQINLPPLDLKSAVERSDYIVSARYDGCDAKSRKKNSCYDPPVAYFTRIRSINGAVTPKHFRVPLYFSNLAGAKPQDWNYDDSKLPKRGSRWILLLNKSSFLDSVSFDTYRGSFGRMEFSSQRFSSIKHLISSLKK